MTDQKPIFAQAFDHKHAVSLRERDRCAAQGHGCGKGAQIFGLTPGDFVQVHGLSASCRFGSESNDPLA